ncbi:MULTISPECIES: hypothetical protein [Prevotellaceae]|uniref:hypothetical protein n=1 Tax=Prevotellaceae TaxID=171552 RepID=UPI00040D9A27|nr:MULTISPECIES: hypothetical protein [Prevotellaceae]
MSDASWVSDNRIVGMALAMKTAYFEWAEPLTVGPLVGFHQASFSTWCQSIMSLIRHNIKLPAMMCL